MPIKFNEIFLITILSGLCLCWVKSCSNVTVILDEEFVGCCRGRPMYTSEVCIDRLLENGTFSSVCLVNCMYKEFEIYDGTDIDLEAVQTFLNVHVADENFHSMFMNAYKRCSKFDKDALKETFSLVQFENDYECDDYPQYLDICIWYHTVANCPEQYSSEDESCVTKSDWVNECLLKT